MAAEDLPRILRFARLRSGRRRPPGSTRQSTPAAGRFRCPRRPPDCEGPAIHPAALLAHGLDVALAAKVLPRADAHGVRGFRDQTTVRRLRPFLRRAASTLRPPRVDFRAR